MLIGTLLTSSSRFWAVTMTSCRTVPLETSWELVAVPTSSAGMLTGVSLAAPKEATDNPTLDRHIVTAMTATRMNIP
jgi:hypothetical protein